MANNVDITLITLQQQATSFNTKCAHGGPDTLWVRLGIRSMIELKGDDPSIRLDRAPYEKDEVGRAGHEIAARRHLLGSVHAERYKVVLRQYLRIEPVLTSWFTWL